MIWNSLRWYPAILLCYSTGVAALANENYANLGAALRTPVSIPYLDSDLSTFILALGEQIFRIEGTEAFKYLPGHEKFRVPRSEYLFKLLQPELDDDLFLGKEYERLFDRFEVLLALIIANDLKSLGKNARGPVGRFAWKFHRPGVFGNPLLETLKEAEKNKESWLPFEAGLFGPSFASFFEMATEYAQMIGNFGW